MAEIGAPPSAIEAFNQADAQGKTGRLPSATASGSFETSMPTREDAVDDDESEAETDSDVLGIQPLSDIDIVSVPPGIVRMLSTFRPIIAALNATLRLATWTAGPHSAPLSVLLVLGWWAVCKFSYPLIRYAPQLLLLSAIGWYYFKAHWEPIRASSSSKQIGDVMGGEQVVVRGARDDQIKTVSNAATLAATVAQLEELADFASTVYNQLIRPCQRAVDWTDPQATLALLAFLAVTYPLYLLCVLPWSQLGIPRLALVFVPHGTGILGAACGVVHWVSELAVRAAVHCVHLLAQWASQHERGEHIVALALSAVQAVLHRWAVAAPYVQAVGTKGLALSRSAALQVIYAVRGSDPLAIPLAPPFPLFSLDVSTLLLIVGTLLLTWCSPLFVLIRHALWSSALVRYTMRRVSSAVTLGYLGQTDMKYYSLRDVFFKKTYNVAGPLKASNNVMDESLDSRDGRDPFELEGYGVPSPILGPALPEDILEPISRVGGKKVEEFRDVVYQFSIYENQRWWVGLDWTAALLPQERASWTDEQNNATLPPSSFSLPDPKLQLNPVGREGVFVKRLSRWEWIDPEWTVAGTGYISAMPQFATEVEAADDGASTITGSVVSGIGGQAAALAGSLSDSLRARLTATNLLALSTFGAEAPTTAPDALEVDTEGWQYGGNSWENMTPRAGMGKYTRHRKWVRRAVLVEVVQRGYTPSPSEAKALESQ